MGIRETMNKNPRRTAMISVGIIVVVGSLIAWRFWPSAADSGILGQLYYTNDDGASYFKDSPDLIPPFKDSTGKEAVRAHVYKVDGTRKVMLMEKYTDAGKAALERVKDQPPSQGKMLVKVRADESQRLLKRPGDAKWLPYSEERSQVMGPDGLAMSEEP